MGDTFTGSGKIHFNGGSFTTEYLAYVLGRANDQPFNFSGTAVIYGLGPKTFMAYGAVAFAGGSAFFSTSPRGAFDDFAIYPEGSPDPVSGFVLAGNAGTLDAGVGNPWTRHWRSVVPPRDTRFVVPHIRYGSIPAGALHYLDGHQLEVLRVDQTAPSDFESARTIKVTVRPKRLNYATGSTHVTNLVPGRTYTASADVNGARVVQTIVPDSDTVDLDFGGPATQILVEEGTVVGDYFDGDSGPDYLWEQGGLAGETRSYYYPDREMRHYVLVRTLAENVALGMTVEDPVYAVLPAPSTTS